MVRPAAKRKVVKYFREKHKLSERRSCKLINQGLTTQRYKNVNQSDDETLKGLLDSFSNKHKRYGYRRLHICLKNAGHKINHKKVYRLYKELDLKLTKKKGKKIKMQRKQEMPKVLSFNDQWSLDFVSDKLTDGRSIRFINIIDNYSRYNIDITASISLPSAKVIRIISNAIAKFGKPKSLLLDNGPEFRSKLFQRWAAKEDIRLCYIAPGKPTQNAYIESFNGKFRDECLDQHWLSNMSEAIDIVEKWRKHYNEERPHSSLEYLSPREYMVKQLCVYKIEKFNCNSIRTKIC